MTDMHLLLDQINNILMVQKRKERKDSKKLAPSMMLSTSWSILSGTCLTRSSWGGSSRAKDHRVALDWQSVSVPLPYLASALQSVKIIPRRFFFVVSQSNHTSSFLIMAAMSSTNTSSSPPVTKTSSTGISAHQDSGAVKGAL